MPDAFICYADKDRLKRELLAAAKPINGWPKPGGPYARLIKAEQQAGEISMLYLGLPPACRAPEYIARLLGDNPRAEQMVRLRLARTNWMRVCALAPEGEKPNVRIFMPSDAMSSFVNTNPDLARDQARILRTAMNAWNIIVIPRESLVLAQRRLGGASVLSSIILKDLPQKQPAAVYTELADDAKESWTQNRGVVAEHMATHDWLAGQHESLIAGGVDCRAGMMAELESILVNAHAFD